jgi:hypothetical protein
VKKARVSVADYALSMLPVAFRPSSFARAFVSGVALVVAAVALAACSGSGGPSSPSPSSVGTAKYSVFPVVVSEDLAPGDNRFLFVFVDKDNKPVSAPDRSASVAFFPGNQPTGSATSNPATFEWGNESIKQGYYVMNVAFPKAGQWSAVFTTAAANGPTEHIPFQFDVKEKHSAVAIGQPAPSTPTPTAASVGGKLAEISTDTSPDPRFYDVSEDQALSQHKPFVIVFATPAFCTSQLCGPTLDRVKAVAKDYPSVAFIHVEPYKMQVVEGRLQPVLDANSALQANDITNAWGLPAEPWAFVVDRTGVVRASLDIVFSDQELRAALDKVK